MDADGSDQHPECQRQDRGPDRYFPSSHAYLQMRSERTLVPAHADPQAWGQAGPDCATAETPPRLAFRAATEVPGQAVPAHRSSRPARAAGAYGIETRWPPGLPVVAGAPQIRA